MQILDPIENVIYARGDLINIYVDVFIFNMKCKGPILNNKVFKTSDFSELRTWAQNSTILNIVQNIR